MSAEAAEIVQHLAQQAQLLASLKSLSTLHVFASIPLERVAVVQDVADVLGLPYDHLLRLIRFVATSGFLREPEPGFVEHTALSAQFVKKPFLLDAVKFLSDTALPAALQTARQMVTLPKGTSGAEHEHDQKWRRQVKAYSRLRRSALDDSVTDILSTLQWTNLGDAKVVQVGPPSIAAARKLSAQFPSLTFIVQMCDGQAGSKCMNGKEDTPLESLSDVTTSHEARISITYRARGQPQVVKDAKIYILYLPGYTLSQCSADVLAEITAEVRVHFEMLRSNPSAKLILVTELLPDPGTIDTKTEAAARTQDLFLMQLSNGGLFGMAQLKELLSNTRDEKGELYIVNHVCSRHGPAMVAQLATRDC